MYTPTTRDVPLRIPHYEADGVVLPLALLLPCCCGGGLLLLPALPLSPGLGRQHLLQGEALLVN